MLKNSASWVLPAYRDYPRIGTDKEQICLTCHATHRLEIFTQWLSIQAQGHNIASIARRIGVDYSYLFNIALGYRRPSLLTYLKLSRLVGYGSYKKDINYAYAYVSYPPDEIRERVKRVAGTQGAAMIARMCGVNKDNMSQSLYYGKKRTLKTYAKGMFMLMKLEKAAGYSDRLHFWR